MAEYIKKIRTDKGDFQIDYEALANLPVSDLTLSVYRAFADAKIVGDRFYLVNEDMKKINGRLDDFQEDINDKLGDYIPQILTSEYYGVELPDAGNKGRIFFKKVNTEE